MADGDASLADSTFLVLLIDTNIHLWKEAYNANPQYGTNLLDPKSFVSQLSVFVNSFLMLHENNRVSAFAIGDRASTLLYEPPELRAVSGFGVSTSDPSEDAGPASSKMMLPADAILRGLRDFVAQSERIRSGSATQVPEEVGYSTALTRAMCYLNRVQKGLFLPGNSAARVLLVGGSPEVPAQYVPIMNSVFAAQKMKVPIDFCYVAASDISFMQQASQITGGVYLRLDRPGAMLQYLLSHFSMDAASRAFLRSASSNDGKVPCFCHRRCINMGYVCSVCLSIFCEKMEKCRTCGTSYALKQQPGAGAAEGAGGS